MADHWEKRTYTCAVCRTEAFDYAAPIGWLPIGCGPLVFRHGDGTSLWTLTHHEDFARGFIPLLGHPRTLAEALSTSPPTRALTWNQIAVSLAAPAGVDARIVHVPSDAIAATQPEWGAGPLGDRSHSMVFDNAKLRRVPPD